MRPTEMAETIGYLTVLERKGRKARCRCQCGRIVVRSYPDMKASRNRGMSPMCNACIASTMWNGKPKRTGGDR